MQQCRHRNHCAASFLPDGVSNSRNATRIALIFAIRAIWRRLFLQQFLSRKLVRIMLWIASASALALPKANTCHYTKLQCAISTSRAEKSLCHLQRSILTAFRPMQHAPNEFMWLWNIRRPCIVAHSTTNQMENVTILQIWLNFQFLMNSQQWRR